MYRWQRSSGWNYYRAPVAILKLDSVQHEYAWIKTTSKYIHTIDGFEQKNEGLSKRGSSLVEVLVDVVCADATREGMHLRIYPPVPAPPGKGSREATAIHSCAVMYRRARPLSLSVNEGLFGFAVNLHGKVVT